MRTISILVLLTIISSCGKSDSSAGIPTPKSKVLPVNGSNIIGLYMAKFETVNSHVNGVLPGSATIQRRDDNFKAYVRLFGGGPGVWHRQNIYMNGRCPIASDDLNADGFIDMQEASKVIGKVLIPLDSNLNTQFSGQNIFPISDPAGSYFYEREASFKTMFNDLKAPDKDETDNITKLQPADGLEFEGMIVVIQGTAETTALPPTVLSEDARSPHQTLPISCGVFNRVTSIPGEVDTGTVPGTVGGPDTSTGSTGEDPNTHPDTTTPDSNSDSDEDDNWYDRVIEWWRRTWETDRDGRTQDWGDGERPRFIQ